jgi:hypothetical protein
MRLVKDSYQIASPRRAAEISGKGFEAAMREIRPGRNDREIAGLMEIGRNGRSLGGYKIPRDSRRLQPPHFCVLTFDLPFR